MLPKQNRLRHSAEIRSVYRHGKRIRHSLFTLYFKQHPTHGSISQLCFTANRRVGNAVMRNRAKRRLRAIVYHQLPQVDVGWHVVIAAKPSTITASHQALEHALLNALAQANVLALCNV